MKPPVTRGASDASLDVSGVAATRDLARLAARDLRSLRDLQKLAGQEWVRLTLIAQMFDRTGIAGEAR